MRDDTRNAISNADGTDSRDHLQANEILASTSLSSYLGALHAIPRLSREEEIRLAKQIQWSRMDLTGLLLDLPEPWRGTVLQDAAEQDEQGGMPRWTVHELGAICTRLFKLEDDPQTQTHLGPVMRAARTMKKNLDTAQEALVVSNLRLVVYMAKKVRSRGVPFLDLIQEGNLGLMKAVDKFEWERGHKFSTCAVWWIRSGLSKAFIDRSSLVRLPGHCRQKIAALKNQIAESLAAMGRTPSSGELAEQMEMTEQEVNELLTLSKEPIPLENRTDDDRQPLLEQLPDQGTDNPQELMEKSQAGTFISNMLDKALNPMERRIVELRFGIDSNTPHTLRQLAEMFSLSREGIRQIEMRALAKLRARQEQFA
jgi:RNA polymerase sigma factor (sigma-70 family)